MNRCHIICFLVFEGLFSSKPCELLEGEREREERWPSGL